jgi:sporulation protein YlmC with PRC-barrel domain
MLFSQVRGLPVVTLTDAEQVGTVRSLIVDAASGVVTRVLISGRRPRRETVLPWDALHAIGPDAVLVHPATAPAEPGTVQDLLGSRVLTEAGDERGRVQDVAFDPDTGRVETLLTAFGMLPADRLLGIGDYALVVRAA